MCSAGEAVLPGMAPCVDTDGEQLDFTFPKLTDTVNHIRDWQES